MIAIYSLLWCIILLLLLLFLLLLHYPRRINTFLVALLHPSLSCTTCLHLTISIFLMSFSTSSFHLVLVLPLGHFLCKLARYIILVFPASSIHRGCHCDLLFSVAVQISDWCKKKFKCFPTLFQSICKTCTFSTLCHLFVLGCFLINFLKQFTFGLIYYNTEPCIIFPSFCLLLLLKNISSKPIWSDNENYVRCKPKFSLIWNRFSF
jgi:hypothetical protein